MTTYKVVARHSGRWWSLQFPEIAQATQCRSIEQIEDTAREALALYDDVPEHTIELDLTIEVPGDAQAHIEEERRLRELAQWFAGAASDAHRRAAHALRSEGLTLKDVGQLLGVSFQRAHQLLADDAPTEVSREAADALFAQDVAGANAAHLAEPAAPQLLSDQQLQKAVLAYLRSFGSESGEDASVTRGARQAPPADKPATGKRTRRIA